MELLILDEEMAQHSEEDFQIHWDLVMEMANRREMSAKQVTPCPKCGSAQVQMTDWRTNILKMKCRKCKHKFTKELQ